MGSMPVEIGDLNFWRLRHGYFQSATIRQLSELNPSKRVLIWASSKNRINLAVYALAT